uniref:Uncharacterized protein n=1 Tax=Rhizophora mucronata TaxID=61149 RepID=A0A2P2KWY4_RHIMU
MEYDIHTLLDLATLATTLWVIYMIRFKLKSSYMEDKDNFALYYVVCINRSNITFSSCITNYLYAEGAFSANCCYKSLGQLQSTSKTRTLNEVLWTTLID